MGFKFELFGRLKKSKPSQDDVESDSQNSDFASPLSTAPQLPANNSSPAPQQFTPAAPIQQDQNSDLKALVLDYSSKGMPEAEIIKTLKSKGYSFDQIDSALSGALKSKVDNRPITSDGMLRQPKTDFKLETFHKPNEINPEPVSDMPGPDEIEAMVERVVEDRITSLKGLVKSIEDSNTDIKSEISDLDKSIRLLENRIDDRISSVNTNLQQFQTNLDDLEPKINSVEKAFKDIVPQLVEEVRQSVAMIKSAKNKTVSPSPVSTIKHESPATEKE